MGDKEGIRMPTSQFTQAVTHARNAVYRLTSTVSQDNKNEDLRIAMLELAKTLSDLAEGMRSLEQRLEGIAQDIHKLSEPPEKLPGEHDHT